MKHLSSWVFPTVDFILRFQALVGRNKLKCKMEKISISVFNHFYTRVIYFTFSQTAICLSKVHNGNTKTVCEICPKLAILTPERRHDLFYTFWKYQKLYQISDVGRGYRKTTFRTVCIHNFENISHIVLVSPLLILKK